MKSPSPSGGIHPIGDGSGGVEIQPPALDRMIVLSIYRIVSFRNGYKLALSESPISLSYKDYFHYFIYQFARFSHAASLNKKVGNPFPTFINQPLIILEKV